MPNHIQNELTITGNETEKIFVYIKGEKDTDFIDFNKIVPMPESLNIDSSSNVETAVKNTLHTPVHKNELIAKLEKMNRAKAESPLKLNAKDWKNFIIGLDNVREHGHFCWYGWSTENWGTKWNAYEQEKNCNILRFETAWSCVSTLINRLSKTFPENTFEYRWADEDVGANTGHIILKDGEIIYERIPENYSREGYDLRFALCPDNRDYYKLVGDNYEYVEED